MAGVRVQGFPSSQDGAYGIPDGVVLEVAASMGAALRG
jgi:hypothetical protein